MHQIDRDAESDWPPTARRYDAFFRIPGVDAVLIITSVGLPNEISNGGRFVYIHEMDRSNIANQIVGFQTAKSPEAVDRNEAWWLSRYSPDQLEALSDIIASATPIDEAEYHEYVRPGSQNQYAAMATPKVFCE